MAAAPRPPSPNYYPNSTTMVDEYTGDIDASGITHTVDTYTFDCGRTLAAVPVRYKTFGTLNAAGDNAVVVCHALTGNASVDVWWSGMVGDGCFVDTTKYFVVCANVVGSCYGTAGPTTINPATRQPYGADFPRTTIRDTVSLHRHVLVSLGVTQVVCAIGGSMGGMQVLEWSFIKEPKVCAGVVLCAGGRHTSWQIGISELQRQAIYADPNFKGGRYTAAAPPSAGLAVARQIAMMSYRTHSNYLTKFGRRPASDQEASAGLGPAPEFSVQSYLRHQGQKFLDRGFDANTYINITQQMDAHDVSRGRGDYHKVLNSITIPMLVVGVTSDILYPVSEQAELAEHLSNAELRVIESGEGHDGFLLEQPTIGPMIQNFLAQRRQAKL